VSRSFTGAIYDTEPKNSLQLTISSLIDICFHRTLFPRY